MDFWVILMVCATLLSGAAAGYFYGVSKTRRQAIGDQNEYVRDLRKENRELLNTVLLKHGSPPIGIERKAEVKEEIISPRVVTRQEMEARRPVITPQVVGYPRVKEETIRKAAEIIDANK